MDATPLLRAYGRLRRRRLARHSAGEWQEADLMRLVRQAKDTRFGRAHDFASIRTVADYQARVPLRSYEDFWEEWFRADFPVLTDVTWPGTVPYFAVSSGTSSGRTKYIPLSREMIRSNAKAGTALLAHHALAWPQSRVLSGKSFMLGGSVALEDLGHGIKAGDLSGIARLETPRWSAPFVFPSVEDALEADWERKIDRLARLSLEENIRCVAGTPSWLLLFFDKLAEITGRGHDVRAFYPGLDLLVYGGTSFAPYRETFASWFPGNGVDWREAYSASEGFVASADGGIDEGMLLNVDMGIFYEFVPIAEWDAPAPRRYTLADAPSGEYGLVLSTCAGLWSYRIGDVVELLSAEPPRLKVTGRTSDFMSPFGEHVSGAEIETAVLAAAGAVGHAVSEYTATALYPGGETTTGRHLYVVELDTVPGEDERRRFAEVLDATLKDENEDYEVHRRADYQLKAPRVVFVAPGTFNDWMRERGKLGGQNKVPRVALAEGVRPDVLALAERGASTGEEGR